MRNLIMKVNNVKYAQPAKNQIKLNGNANVKKTSI